MTYREMGIEEARGKLGDLVKDAREHGRITAITASGKPAVLLVPDIERLKLKDRITAVLVASGFTEYSPFTSARNPAFDVGEGVGATVNLSWEASDEERALMLAKYENRLRENGLTVENRGWYLYVSAPSTETTQTSTEEN